MMTNKRFKEVFWDGKELGRFFWDTKIRGIKIGTQAGSFDAHGYGQIRPDIAKCPGTESDLCERCCRKLAPSAERQAWTEPPMRDGECASFEGCEE